MPAPFGPKRPTTSPLSTDKEMSDKTGEEQNKFVLDQIIAICKKWHITINRTQISAIIESAYVAMKQGESNGK